MATQRGPASLDQLVELGLTQRAVQQRAAAGRLHRIYHAVYALVPEPLLTRDGRVMAAVLACGQVGAREAHLAPAHP